MTVLGNLALWLALLVGVWGALAGVVGGRLARPDLGHSARGAGVAVGGAVRGGGRRRLPPALRKLAAAGGVRDVRRASRGRVRARVGVIPARLQRRVRRRVHQPQPADLLYVVGAVRG